MVSHEEQGTGDENSIVTKGSCMGVQAEYHINGEHELGQLCHDRCVQQETRKQLILL